MKRKITIMLVLLILSSILFGCAEQTTLENPMIVSTPDPREVQLVPENEEQANTQNEGNPPSGNNVPGLRRTDAARAAATVDVDLTALSSTMLSAEIANIIANSRDYLGKVIRINGMYSNIHISATDMVYHFIITVEGDDCCQEGLEFTVPGRYVFPDDFPKQRTRIEVDGVFSVIEEQGQRFFYLAADDIFILD